MREWVKRANDGLRRDFINVWRTGIFADDVTEYPVLK